MVAAVGVGSSMLSDLDHPVQVETDHVEEFVDALEHAADLSERLTSNVRLWRWLIIALHMSLQGACVCALRGRDTSGMNVLEKRARDDMIKWRKERDRTNSFGVSRPNDRRLASLLTLFARVCDPEYLREPHTLSATEPAIEDVKTLGELRDRFVHFRLQGLSLNVQGMPRVVRHVCEIIEQLTLERPGPYLALDLNVERRARIEAALIRVREGVGGWAASA